MYVFKATAAMAIRCGCLLVTVKYVGKADSVPYNYETGKPCTIECDLEYPQNVKKLTYKYPLLPEKKSIRL